MTEETKVEVNEQEVVSDEKPLNNYENPIIINAFKTPAIMAFPFKDDVKYLRDFAVSLPVIDPEANLIQSKNDHVLDLEEFKELKELTVCHICADSSPLFEYTPCCNTPICEGCLTKTFETFIGRTLYF